MHLIQKKNPAVLVHAYLQYPKYQDVKKELMKKSLASGACLG